MKHPDPPVSAEDVAPRPDLNLAYRAWTIIAKVPWDDLPEDWVTAAKTWRDAFHAALRIDGSWQCDAQERELSCMLPKGHDGDHKDPHEYDGSSDA